MPARTEHGGRPLTLRSRARLTLRAALGTTVAASATPYGYTVSLWSSGALLMRSHGTPGVAEVFAFMAGAVTGSGLMGLLAQGALALVAARHSPPIDR